MLGKKIALAGLVICLIAGLSSCMFPLGWSSGSWNVSVSEGNGKTLNGDRNVEIKEVSLADSEYRLVIEDIQFTGGRNWSGKIVIDESLRNEVVLSTDRNILNTINITVDDERIMVRGDRDFRYDSTEFEIRIGAKVNDFAIDGAFELQMDVPSVTEFSGTINGAVDGNMAFGQLDRFSLNINGAGTISIKGESERSAIVINGAGEIRAFDFRTENTDITINGTGTGNVYAANALHVSINGVGNVTYDGNPSTINAGTGFLSSVKKR